MIETNRGNKHVCADCATRFYDMNRPSPACPKCGGKPAVAKALKPLPVSRIGVTETFRRFK